MPETFEVMVTASRARTVPTLSTRSTTWPTRTGWTITPIGAAAVTPTAPCEAAVRRPITSRGGRSPTCSP
jgi:hypothetical protein